MPIILVLVLLLLSRHGFAFLPVSMRHRHGQGHGAILRGSPAFGVRRSSSYPNDLEDWDSTDVEDWLASIGFGRYAPRFAADFSGIGVDGDRLVYLGTEDQLDHIEYQLELVGVEDRTDQLVLGRCIIELVAASPNLTPELLESLAEGVPIEHRDDRRGLVVSNDDGEEDADGDGEGRARDPQGTGVDSGCSEYEI